MFVPRAGERIVWVSRALYQALCAACSKDQGTPLNVANLHRFASPIQTPQYDRKELPQRIVHIGVGGFHRAHQAVYLDDLLHLPGGTEWSICGVCLLPRDKKMYETMKTQDCLYTVVEQSSTGHKARVIGSINASNAETNSGSTSVSRFRPPPNVAPAEQPPIVS